MKKLIVMFIAVSLAVACSSDENHDNSTHAKGIKTFANERDFRRTLDLLASFKSGEDFEKWSSTQDFKPLYHAKGFVDNDEIPFRLLYILNENKQFMIGENIITLSDGKLYERPGGTDSANAKVFATFSVSKVPYAENSGSNNSSRVDIDADEGSYKEGWQEFDREKYAVGCATPVNKPLKYRLVHYLIVDNIDTGSFIQTTLLWKLRMSQYNNGSWVYNNTTTERLFSFNISGNWYIRNKSTNAQYTNGYGAYSISDSNSCSTTVKGTQVYQIGYLAIPKPVNMSLVKWDVSLSGSVFHQVNGDTDSVNTSITW
jgi:hypothetical protein